jgi:uncharacterized membrane protein
MVEFQKDHPLDIIKQKAELTISYIVLMSMSGILSAVALLTSSVQIFKGAMVIARSLPPLALISLALFKRRTKLLRKGVWSALAGLLIATLFAIITTWLLNVSNVVPPEANLLEKPLLEERVPPGWFSVVAASAAGIAGMIALTDEKLTH